MMNKGNFAQVLIDWYHKNKRDLPWRNTQDPYKIWLSEIILQQTRVIQGLPYFYRFEENYPSVGDLASASEDQVLKDWEGLGYYSRARNMKKAAQMVVNEFGGVFPSQYENLLKLPGIGDYTASAVSSFSTNEARPVLDGNVYRFLSRYFGIDDPINIPKSRQVFMDVLNDVIDFEKPGLFNQAIMEFGALQCKPQSPLCETCPFNLDCVALKNDLIKSLPVKLKAKKPKPRYFNYFILQDEKEDFLWMKRRGESDIWAGLYEFYNVESQEAMSVNDEEWVDSILSHFGSASEIVPHPKTYKNVLSHQIIYASFYFVTNFDILNLNNLDLHYVSSKDFATLAKPKVINLFLSDHNLTN